MPARSRPDALMSVDNLVSDKHLHGAHVKLVRTDPTMGWPSFGEQALQVGVVWRYLGCDDGRTLVFVNVHTNMPVQIFRNELQGARFSISMQ